MKRRAFIAGLGSAAAWSVVARAQQTKLWRIGLSVELLHPIFPDARRIAVLMSSNPNHPKMYDLANSAANAIGLSTTPVVASMPTDVDRAFQEIGQANCDAVFILGDPIRPQIVTLAAKAKIPALYQYSEYAEIGGLATYGPSLRSTWKRSAQYVVNIFKGADPADLPVEQPTRFELVLNLRTAKALGLTIPDIVLARADEVIE